MLYEVIDKYGDKTANFCNLLTWQQVLAFFAPSEEEDSLEVKEKWDDIKDLFDLKEFLKWEYGGMEIPYSIEEREEM